MCVILSNGSPGMIFRGLRQSVRIGILIVRQLFNISCYTFCTDEIILQPFEPHNLAFKGHVGR